MRKSDDPVAITPEIAATIIRRVINSFRDLAVATSAASSALDELSAVADALDDDDRKVIEAG
jgi:hypothetical protein